MESPENSLDAFGKKNKIRVIKRDGGNETP